MPRNERISGALLPGGRARGGRGHVLKAMLSSMQWHFLLSPPGPADQNMAFDEALMFWATRTGDAAFRVYGWSTPTLSLGRNQRARGLYNLDAARSLGVGIVRRPTGGRALLHHREITYSVTLPTANASAAGAIYIRINAILVEAMRSLGVDATLATQTFAMPPGPRPCFDVPSAHEIVVGTRKLIGSAQWRRNGVMLQHGSILVCDDQPLIPRLMLAPEGPPPEAATLAVAMGREPSLEEVAGALKRALAAAVGKPPHTFQSDDVLLGDVDRLSDGYRDDAWTWRR